MTRSGEHKIEFVVKSILKEPTEYKTWTHVPWLLMDGISGVRFKIVLNLRDLTKK